MVPFPASFFLFKIKKKAHFKQLNGRCLLSDAQKQIFQILTFYVEKDEVAGSRPGLVVSHADVLAGGGPVDALDDQAVLVDEDVATGLKFDALEKRDSILRGPILDS